MGILASAAPLSDAALLRRFVEPGIDEVRSRMSLFEVEQLTLIELFDTRQLQFLTDAAQAKTHTLDRPSLSYASDRLRFVGDPIAWERFIDARLARLTRHDARRETAFRALLMKYLPGLQCLEPTDGMQLFCERFGRLREAFMAYGLRPDLFSVSARAQAYDVLRQEGVIPPDPGFLTAQIEALAEDSTADPATVRGAVEQLMLAYAKDGLWDDAARSLGLLSERGLIDAQYHGTMTAELARGREGRDAFVRSYGDR